MNIKIHITSFSGRVFKIDNLTNLSSLNDLYSEVAKFKKSKIKIKFLGNYLDQINDGGKALKDFGMIKEYNYMIYEKHEDEEDQRSICCDEESGKSENEEEVESALDVNTEIIPDSLEEKYEEILHAGNFESIQSLIEEKDIIPINEEATKKFLNDLVLNKKSNNEIEVSNKILTEKKKKNG